MYRIKQILEDIGGDRIHIGFDDNDWDRVNDDDGSFYYENDVEYKMTANKGIVRTNVKLKNGEYSYDSENNNDETDEALEEFKQSREKLKQEVEEKKRRLRQDSLELEEKQKELNKSIDTTPKYKYKAQIPQVDIPKKVYVVDDKKNTGYSSFYSESFLNRITI